MSNTDRCETTSGRFRCDHSAGHDGECETEDRSGPRIGTPIKIVLSARNVQASKRDGAGPNLPSEFGKKGAG